MNKPEQSPLGKASAYVDHYDASLLFPIPRSEKRDELAITRDLPFTGEDIWNAYELSWLTRKGKPVVAIATLRIPATSPNIVESKSFKLYLNSFNQTRYGQITDVENVLKKDISKVVGCAIEVVIQTVDQVNEQLSIGSFDALCIDDLDVDVDIYETSPELLKTIEGRAHEKLMSHLLKSNCLVTGQPDWGSVVIEYEGPAICHESLLKYLISFRQHNEFHEQCVERIFVDLKRRCRCEHLSVYARYVRRGGLDINPFRTDYPGRTAQNIRLVRQ